MRTAPYQTAERAIRGVVIELIPVAAPQNAADIVVLNELVDKVLDSLPHEVVLIDQALRMIWMNRCFQTAWHVGVERLGQPLEALLPRTPAHEQLWAAIEDAVFTGRPFEDVSSGESDGAGAGASLRWSASHLSAEPGRAALTMLALQRKS